jgi:signal transduction histidine kinase
MGARLGRMRGSFRLPLSVAAGALLILIAGLATLQYRWLGRISDAERERMKTTLNARAAAFAQDVDRELTRAYLTFQFDPIQLQEDPASRTAARYDRWQATARFPKIVKDVFLVTVADAPQLERFDASTRAVLPAEWPASLQPLRAQLASAQVGPASADAPIVRTLPPPLLDDVPALVVPAPVFLLERHGASPTHATRVLCTVLVLDRHYIQHELLPALAQQHFRGTGDGFDYQIAVVQPASNSVVYHSAADFSPSVNTPVDTSVELFQVRLQDFGELVSEVRRFSTFMATAPREISASDGPGGPRPGKRILHETLTMPLGDANVKLQPSAPISIVVESAANTSPDRLFAAGAVTRAARPASPHWRLMVKHPSGSLEYAVDSARRRNLLVSSGILAVLGISVGFLIVSTRRAEALARQQMEFVATVSHELRTPLAVIRSAADNLADGVVTDEGHVRRYGELVRSEGRRLSELVEQVLEYAGLQAGERPVPPRPVSLELVLRDVVSSARALADSVGVNVELAVPDTLPTVAGDEPALRRVFQNLVGNALKYGAEGRWVGVRAAVAGEDVEVSVEDRGIGISAADQTRIFDPFYRAPDVVAAQIQGAGLGLSLVKRIVDAHHGRIVVTSTPGAGSTFVVRLPIAAGTPAESASSVGAAAAQHS